MQNVTGIVAISGTVSSVKTLGSLAVVGTDQDAAYAHSAPVNTQVNIDITKPTTVKSRYLISIYNPSTVTDLTVKVHTKELALGGGTRYGLVTSFTVIKAQTLTGTAEDTYPTLLEGIFLATDLRLTISNNTELGAAAGFSASVRVREGD